ncbi:NepR family anti-sigma factor [Ciceribacter ferrooxidans]|uniref:NepR family anti-sigma factor n=1 Tax=Ciceribacter ferrooxidans TaxID=2509717 RepID=UPI0013EA09EB
MAPEKMKDRKARPKRSDAGRELSNTLIASKLRGYYDSIVEEGTPKHFLDLLERLDDAERNSTKK